MAEETPTANISTTSITYSTFDSNGTSDVPSSTRILTDNLTTEVSKIDENYFNDEEEATEVNEDTIDTSRPAPEFDNQAKLMGL
jgi:hypothetical protein